MAEDKKPTIVGPLSSEEVNRRAEPAANFVTVFSNYSRVAATPVEFRIFFGETYPTASGEIKVVERLNVVLTLVQAKQLLNTLSSTLANIEASGVLIPDPKSFPTLRPAGPNDDLGQEHKADKP